MSTNAYAKLKGCGSCDYFQDFAKFVAYYGKANFADLLIEGAFNGEVVPMKHGDWDFSHFDQEARAGESGIGNVSWISKIYICCCSNAQKPFRFLCTQPLLKK